MRVIGLGLAGVLALTGPIAAHPVLLGSNMGPASTGPTPGVVQVWGGGGSGWHPAPGGGEGGGWHPPSSVDLSVAQSAAQPLPPPTAPRITSIAPTSGPVGAQVTINGSGFGAMQGSSYAAMGIFAMETHVSWSDTQIVATVPGQYSPGQSAEIIVTTSAGGSNAAGPLSVTSTAPPPPPPPPGVSLQVTAPVMTVLGTIAFTKDQANPPNQVYNTAVSDAAMVITASASVPFAATTTGGMKNLEVWMHGKKVQQFTPDAHGNVSGTLDFSHELNGPVVLDVYAWDGVPGQTYNYQVKQRLLLFVTGAADFNRGTPVGAQGMTLAFADEFTSALSISKTDHTANWYTHQVPQSLDYGDAAFEENAGTHNPFHQQGSFLRIRCQNDPNYVDPYGFRRKWYSGFLSAGKPDGTATVAITEGYMEIRVLAPTGSNPWPAFWSLAQEGLTGSSGSIELDIFEALGLFPTVQRPVVWPEDRSKVVGPDYPGAKRPTPIPSPPAASGGNFAWDFHTFGMQIKNGVITMYQDDIPVQTLDANGNPSGTTWTAPMPLYNGAPAHMFPIITHALGSGFPNIVPPAGYYDMWVDYVRVYK